jgi:hypothetical protein
MVKKIQKIQTSPRSQIYENYLEMFSKKYEKVFVVSGIPLKNQKSRKS